VTKLLERTDVAILVTDGDQASAGATSAITRAGAAIGRLLGFTVGGDALIRVAPNGEALVARSAVILTDGDAGHDVVLVFEAEDAHRPIVLGILRTPAKVSAGSGNRIPVELEVDSEKVELRASRQIVLRCGGASVTLTHEGKIIVRGSEILSRATGLNRLKGGAVQIN
jgi:hypothetical protein